MPAKAPDFIAGGTFYWDELGYSFSAPAPSLLDSAASLSSPDPWIVLAAVLTRAKAGQFDSVVLLEQFLSPDASALLVRACVDLLGDVATEPALECLSRLLKHESDEIKIEVCRGCRQSGSLRLVPGMLDAWQSLKRYPDRTSVSSMISALLEESPGAICEFEGITERQYRDLVMHRVEELKDLAGGRGEIPFWKGRVFGVVSLAEEMLRLLRAEDATLADLEVDFIELRHKFEASTGIACSRFFKNEQFQPLAAFAVLEEFLAGQSPPTYAEGVRYFFSRPVAART
jgi:hypothetical protein